MTGEPACTPKLDLDAVRRIGHAYAIAIVTHCPSSREHTTVPTKLEEVVTPTALTRPGH